MNSINSKINILNERVAHLKIQEFKALILKLGEDSKESRNLVNDIEKMEKSELTNNEILDDVVTKFNAAFRNVKIDDILTDDNEN